MAQCGVCSTCGTPAGTTGGSHISVAVGDDKQSFNEVVNVGRFDPPDNDFSMIFQSIVMSLLSCCTDIFWEVIEQCEKSMRTTGLVDQWPWRS